MIFPDRLNGYEDSVIFIMYLIIENLSQGPIRPDNLYNIIKDKCSLKMYMDALDCLYMINMIEFCDDSGVLKYVNRN